DRLFDALDRDGYVLVGEPERLVAVATPTDLIDYLYAVAHPFVLIQEIELALRALVRSVIPMDAIPESIERAVRSFYKERPDAMPTELNHLTLRELVLVVVTKDNYQERFTSVLGRNRDSASSNLSRLHDLRNEVFHFRRPLTDNDITYLKDARS